MGDETGLKGEVPIKELAPWQVSLIASWGQRQTARVILGQRHADEQPKNAATTRLRSPFAATPPLP
jgi:hypothetical protein